MRTKFTEMKYERPDFDALKEAIKEYTKKFSEAKDYAEAKAVFLEKEECEKHINSQFTIASIRNSIDTRDEFYDAEMKVWYAVIPEIEEYMQ